MLVWRVAHNEIEHKHFPAGPYACWESLPEDVYDALSKMHNAHCDVNHPSPYSYYSGLYGIRPEERCGFNSREALYEWFANYTEMLDANGFRVFVYDVPDFAVQVGELGQVVFTAYEAIEKSREDLDLSPSQISLFEMEHSC
ncbi:hypothetical protein ACFQ8S_06775 [Streptomyces virginiae]|uniref:hypothetical protein n=1 Tax=Streptomyces virginiae TaxID=1961 RepID=UPI0036B47441